MYATTTEVEAEHDGERYNSLIIKPAYREDEPVKIDKRDSQKPWTVRSDHKFRGSAGRFLTDGRKKNCRKECTWIRDAGIHGRVNCAENLVTRRIITVKRQWDNNKRWKCVITRGNWRNWGICVAALLYGKEGKEIGKNWKQIFAARVKLYRYYLVMLWQKPELKVERNCIDIDGTVVNFVYSRRTLKRLLQGTGEC